MYWNFLVLLSTTVCSQNINKQNENIADETLTDYSFLSYTKSKNYLKRRYRISHWIPMFIGTPCMTRTKFKCKNVRFSYCWRFPTLILYSNKYGLNYFILGEERVRFCMFFSLGVQIWQVWEKLMFRINYFKICQFFQILCNICPNMLKHYPIYLSNQCYYFT